MTFFLVNDKFRKVLDGNGISSPKSLWELKGEDAKRKTSARGTEKIILNGNEGKTEFYLKRYNPISLYEIIKNTLAFKPVFTDGAIHEWKALKAFEENKLSAPSPVAVAKFANGKSCLLSLGIKDYIRASEFLSKNYGATRARRRIVIKQIAQIAGRMHFANFAHQDFYLLHFFVVPAENDKVYLIDLQRVIMAEKKLAKRWIIKDLAQLIFSAEEIVSRQEMLRFYSIYGGIVGEFCDDSVAMKAFVKAERIKKRFARKTSMRNSQKNEYFP